MACGKVLHKPAPDASMIRSCPPVTAKAECLSRSRYHHRLHHRGVITITGPADQLKVTDSDGRPLRAASLARPPTLAPPDVPPWPGPTGERADWWWYEPFQPQPPPTNN
jgi:hypothetical protein